jgi:hypothetical protein
MMMGVPIDFLYDDLTLMLVCQDTVHEEQKPYWATTTLLDWLFRPVARFTVE